MVNEGFHDMGWNKVIGLIILVLGVPYLISGIMFGGGFFDIIIGGVITYIGWYTFTLLTRKRKKKSFVIQQKMKESVVLITEAEIEVAKNGYLKGYLAVTPSKVAFINYSNDDVYSINIQDIDTYGSKHRNTGDKLVTVGQSFARTSNIEDYIFYVIGETNGEAFSYVWRCNKADKVKKAVSNTSIAKQIFSKSNAIDEVLKTHKL